MLIGIAERMPGLASVIREKRQSDGRRIELRDAIGNQLLSEWESKLHAFDRRSISCSKGRRTAQVTWNIEHGGAASIVRKIHAVASKAYDSLVFYGNPRESSVDPSFQGIEPDVLSREMVDFGWQHSMRGFASTTTEKLIRSLRQQDVGLVHLHNCHPDYFNLFMLPELSRQFRTVWTLHDEYAYTGHCGYTLGCDGWTKSCTPCPFVSRYVELGADRAGEHFKIKTEIYSKSKITVVCVSDWLADRARRSILRGHDIRVIHNGIDTGLFRPAERAVARNKLGLPQERFLIGYCADGGIDNPWKGGKWFAEIAGKFSKTKYSFVCIGGTTRRPTGEMIELGYLRDPHLMVDAYNAMDIWAHPTEADSFGLVVGEAMACGIPVIASRVGAIPELIEHGSSGALVDSNDFDGFRLQLEALANDPGLRRKMGAAARERIIAKFSDDRMTASYMNLYEELLDSN